MRRQDGFAVIELALLVGLVAVLGFVVVKVTGSKPVVTTPSLVTKTHTQVPEVKTTTDLTSAEKSVDEEPVDDVGSSSELNDLSSDLNSF